MIRQPDVLVTFALASVLFGLGTVAQAADGVRLNFGGPLGTFIATPTPGYGGASGYATAAPKTHTLKRAPVATADRNKPKLPRQVVPVRYTPTTNAPKSIPVTAVETQPPGLLGRTLALDSLPRSETVQILAPAETVVARDADASETIATAKTASKVATVDRPATCRKFIPAVGVTVTVACD